MDTGRAVQYISARMFELGLGTRDLKPLGGPSEDTVRRFLRGDIPQSVQAATLQKFDVALGWRRGSLREILFSDGEPTPSNDYDSAREASAEAGVDMSRWCVIPQWMVRDNAAMLSELSLLTRDEAGPIAEGIRRAHTLAADMLAIMYAGGRSPEEVATLAERLAREP